MAKPSDVFKKRKYVCEGDPAHHFEELRWESQLPPPCPACGAASHHDVVLLGIAPGVIGDEIDVTVRHGLCNEDGTPRRFTSMAELRREASARGLVIYGETPNPTSQQKEREAQYQESRRR